MAKPDSKVIVITGVTRGLGRALATKFVALGHVVVGCGRSPEAVAELGRTYPAPHDFEAIDVANEEQVRRWAKRALKAAGAPDLLLNNAALINRNARLWDVSGEDFDRVIDVNIKGVTNVIRHFLPAMIERGTGVVVN